MPCEISHRVNRLRQRGPGQSDESLLRAAPAAPRRAALDDEQAESEEAQSDSGITDR